MWNIQIAGVDIYHIVNWFYIYSFLGWLWESSYVSIKEKKLVNRGFVAGPVCTIYGFGAVIVYLILKPIAGNILLLYICGVIVPTILEYVTAVLMEALFHTSWWDYSKNKFNFPGRIPGLGSVFRDSLLCISAFCGLDCEPVQRGDRKAAGERGDPGIRGGFRHVLHERHADWREAAEYGRGYGRAVRIYPEYEAL